MIGGYVRLAAALVVAVAAVAWGIVESVRASDALGGIVAILFGLALAKLIAGRWLGDDG